MADKKLIAAAFAAGLAGGGAGGDQLAQQEIDAANARVDEVQAVVEQIDVHSPTILSYVRQAANLTIIDTIRAELVPDRAIQLRQLAGVIRENLERGENVDLANLTLRLAERSGEEWVDWYAVNFGAQLQAQIAIGQAVGNLVPEQLVLLRDVADTMDAAADVYLPESPLVEQELIQSEIIAAEDAALRGDAE